MITAMKRCFITLLALGVTGCLSGALSDPSGTPPTDLGATSFPIGTYTNCAQGVHNPSGNVFLNVAGFESGGVLTLAQSGTTVMSTYVEQNGGAQSVSFSTTTGTSATVAQKGQVIPGLDLRRLGQFQLVIPRALGAGVNMVFGFDISVARRFCISAP